VTKASNLDITTSGQSSAAIRTDRGGGSVTVDGGTYTSNGLGSPAIYSTADISVSNATLTSNLSEGVCIEGLNSIKLENCDLTANNTKQNGNATFLDTIMIYQSMSGDANSGTSSFSMSGGSITSKSGNVFHVTNTDAVITLNNVTIKNEDSNNILLSVCADGWSGGSNIATLDATSQKLSGLVKVGNDSTLTMNLSSNSNFEGTIDGNISEDDKETWLDVETFKELHKDVLSLTYDEAVEISLEELKTMVPIRDPLWEEEERLREEYIKIHGERVYDDEEDE